MELNRLIQQFICFSVLWCFKIQFFKDIHQRASKASKKLLNAKTAGKRTFSWRRAAQPSSAHPSRLRELYRLTPPAPSLKPTAPCRITVNPYDLFNSKLLSSRLLVIITSLPKVIWEEGRVAALSHTYAVKSPLVTMARPKFAPKSTPSRGPILKPYYLPHPWTRLTYDAKRLPDQIVHGKVWRQ